MNIAKILGGVMVLFLGFYVIYLGADIGSNIVTFLGILISLLGAVIVFIYRYKENMKIIYNYRKAIEELKKDPHNEELIQKAYEYGKEFYRSRRAEKTFTKKDKEILEMDISYARGKLR